MRAGLLVGAVAFLVATGCGVKKVKDLVAKAARESAGEEQEADDAAPDEGMTAEAAGEEEEFAFPAKGLAAVEDAMSKGDPMLGEATWKKIVKAGAELAPVIEDFKKLTEGDATPDRLPPSKERTLAVIEAAGFESVEQFKDVGEKLQRMITLQAHLRNLESVMAASAEFKKSVGTQAVATAMGAGEAVKAARAAGKAQTDYLKAELQGKAYTKKDVELYCKYKKAHSKEVEAFLIASLMADMLLEK